eukprot:Partr_v1_DN26737_c1_g1_i21_m8725 putative PQ loop repeat protein
MGIVDWLRDIAHSAPIQCKEPNDPTTLALSLFIVVGMFFSYLPQHIKIIRLKSSDGLSPWYQLLGCIASASVVQNAFILQFGLFKCCEIFVRFLSSHIRRLSHLLCKLECWKMRGKSVGAGAAERANGVYSHDVSFCFEYVIVRNQLL